ncbi:uncharacterized protein [Clytia hemisphaerica]|uniref:uncharacterized protein n=1 Tax=Clytia hemisphaerica TaxID=252671 RepID=UPI0034D732DB
MGLTQNDYFKEKIRTNQSRYIFVFSILVLLLSIGCLATASLLKKESSDIQDDVFVVWAAIPAVLSGLLGIITSISRKKLVLMIFLLLTCLSIVLCGLSTTMSGLAYNNQSWSYIGEEAKNCDNRTVGKCLCVVKVVVPAPFASSTCEVLEDVAHYLLVQSSLLAVLSILSIISAFFATSFLCCLPWSYLEDQGR